MSEDLPSTGIVLGLKIIAALFEEAKESRVSVRSLQFLKKGARDVLAARVQYPAMIQAAIQATYGHLSQVAKFAHTPPEGSWLPHIKLFEGVDLVSELAGRLPSNFGVAIDENLAEPFLMVKTGDRWELHHS